MKASRGNPGLKGQLRDCSIDAYISALEIINKVSMVYRIQTFTYLICNAWELLLKAKLLDMHDNNRKIIYEKRKLDGESKNHFKFKQKTITLREALKKVFVNEIDPIRYNLERVAVFRDDSTHFVISNVPPNTMGVFQSCVLNYHTCLVDWFHFSLASRFPLGMMSIVYEDTAGLSGILSGNPKIKHTKETLDFLKLFEIDIIRESEKTHHSKQYMISIDHKLALIQKPDNNTILISKDSSASENITPLYVPKDPAKIYPYYFNDLLLKLNQSLSLKNKLNRNNLISVNIVHKIKGNKIYHFKSVKERSYDMYSEAYYKWLLTQYDSNNNFFNEASEIAKQSKQKHRHVKK